MKLDEGQIAFLDGLFSAAEDEPDGAWAAMCQDLVRMSGEFPGMDPFEVWIAWCEAKSTEGKETKHNG